MRSRLAAALLALLALGLGAAAPAMAQKISCIGLCFSLSQCGVSESEAPGGGGDTAFVTGQTLGVLVNNFGNYIGFQFTVGASNITVTQLGRWVVAGNSGSHALDIFDTNTSIGTVTVNTSGAPAGAFFYGTLASPVVLISGQSYFIMSLEANGGDQFYAENTTITTTAVGTLLGSAYQNAGINIQDVAAPAAYVPLDFKYQ